MKELTLEITQRCLNNCIYCSSCSNPKTINNIIKFEEIENILKDARQLGFTQLNLSGGEPFLHTDIMKIIELASTLKFDIVIYTSGLYTTLKNNIDSRSYMSIPLEYIKECKRLNVKKIIFNMQCNNSSVHEAITNIKQTQTCRDKSILDCINNNIDTEINIVPMKINLQYINETTHKAIELGCNKINFLGLVLQGRAIKNKDYILMNELENEMLQHTLHSLKIEYGDKIRIGNPLKEISSNKCSAGINRLTIRYDGNVFPCEAFKYKNDFNNTYPMNIHEYSLIDIVKNSKYLKLVNEYIKSCKNATCSDCPAQKLLNCKCALDLNNKDETSYFISKSYQDSTSIFKEHMEGFLSTNYSDMAILKIKTDIVDIETKTKLIQKNYLFSNLSAINITENSHVLVSKKTNYIKAIALDKIQIDKNLFYSIGHGNLINMIDYKFPKIEDSEYVLWLEPYFNSEIQIDNQAKQKFLSEYLEEVTYPHKNKIKYNIAVSMNKDFEKALIDKGFVQHIDKQLYKIFIYITPNQFCRNNIFKLVEELK